MLKFIPLFIICFSLGACSKDAPTIPTDQIEERAEEIQNSFNLEVFVSYVDHYAASCEPVFMADQQVYILEGLVNLGDFLKEDAIMSRRTDVNGKAICESLEAGKYSVYVSTIYGTSIRRCEVGNDLLNSLTFELTK